MKKIYCYFLIGEKQPVTGKKLIEDTLVELEVVKETEMVWHIITENGHPRGFNKAGWSMSARTATLNALRRVDKKIKDHQTAVDKLRERKMAFFTSKQYWQAPANNK